MEMVGKQNLRNDIMSDCRSFGSNYQPCSRSGKISIGIVVDKSDKTRHNNVRENVAMPQTMGNLTSSKTKAINDANKKENVGDLRKGQQTEDPEKETSPWVSTRSLHQNIPSPEAVQKAKQASSLPPSMSAVLKQRQSSNDANGSQGKYSVQFTGNQKSILQSDDEQQKKFNRVSYRTNEGKDASSARVEEFSFATAQQVIVPDKEMAEDKTNNTENKGNETLRMKLWQVLGTVSSSAKQGSKSQALKTGTDNLESQLKIDVKANTIVKPRQNSDTIESDSDSPNTMRRPVTRSLTRKKPIRVQENKMKNISSSSYKQKNPEKNVFSSEEGWSRRISAAANGGSSVSKRKKSKRDSSRTKPRKFCIPECNVADKAHQAAYRSKTKTPAEKSSLFGDRLGRFSNLPSIESKDSHKSPVMEKTDNQVNLDEPMLQKTMDQQEDFVNPSLKNILDPQLDFLSPTVEMKKSNKTSSLGSSPKNNKGEHSTMDKVINMEGIRSFKSLLTSKPDYGKKNEAMETSDDEGEHEDSPVTKSVPVMNKNHTESGPSKSLSEENDSESSDEEGSPTEGPSEVEIPSPDIGTAQKSEFVFHPTKRRRIHEGVEVTGFSPTPASSKDCAGTEEINELPSELNQENGLASAVALFAMILERVKSKMKSMTSKRSAEILTSVATEIHLQLQNAESQIQTDMGKLTSIGKSKRKRLETRFQEQQDQLKVIYERFRDEVNQHLQDCWSTLGGMEAHQIEFKGTVEKLKASHKKLLLQAEEAIETQLHEAQTRITAVHKSARDKMLQLKYVIAECLNEDTLS